MSVLNRSVVDAINKAYIDIFEDELAGVVPTTMESLGLVLEINGRLGTGKTVNVAWLRNYVRMREWIGEREVHDGEAFEFLLTNTKYETTIRTTIEDLEDGIAAALFSGQSQVEAMVEAYQHRRNRELQRLLTDAFTDTNTLDGVPLIDEAHPYGQMVYDATRPRGQKWYFNQAGTYSNEAASGERVLNEDNLWIARRKFLQRVDYKGEPLGVMPDRLIVGPTQERTAMQILNRAWKETGSNGAAVDNESQNMFSVTVDPRITGTAWFLVVSNPPRKKKPFIFWDRTPLQLQMVGGQATPDAAEGTIDNYVFNNDAILHGARTRMGFGYGSPEYIFGSLGA